MRNFDVSFGLYSSIESDAYMLSWLKLLLTLVMFFFIFLYPHFVVCNTTLCACHTELKGFYLFTYFGYLWQHKVI